MIDNYGNAVPTHDLDLEYVYPPKSERICAQDERFASVNEAIGTLQYNLEQHIEKCADGLAPLADFITSSWAVIDELEARIAQLEAAQPKPTISRWPAADHPPEGDWAHIPAAEWEAIVEELEWLRNQRAVMDADGVLLSHDAWDAVERELHELQAFKAGVPWAALFDPSAADNRLDIEVWYDNNAPQEAGEC